MSPSLTPSPSAPNTFDSIQLSSFHNANAYLPQSTSCFHHARTCGKATSHFPTIDCSSAPQIPRVFLALILLPHPRQQQPMTPSDPSLSLSSSRSNDQHNVSPRIRFAAGECRSSKPHSHFDFICDSSLSPTGLSSNLPNHQPIPKLNLTLISQ